MKLTGLSNPTALLALLSLFAFTGCDSERKTQIHQLTAENATLAKELEQTKQELEDLKFGAPRLWAEVQSQTEKGDWGKVQKLSGQLQVRHPNTPESVLAGSALANATLELAKIAVEAEAKKAKEIAAAQKLKTSEEKRIAASVSRMRTKVDSIEGVTWYYDRTTPRYTNYNSFHLYLGKRGLSSPSIRLRVQYNADDWLFIESFLVVADGDRFEYGPVDFERDNDSEIWEWYDEPATSRDLEMIKAVIASREAVIRLNGRQYRKDRTITSSQKKALQNVLDAYIALGGT